MVNFIKKIIHSSQFIQNNSNPLKDECFQMCKLPETKQSISHICTKKKTFGKRLSRDTCQILKILIVSYEQTSSFLDKMSSIIYRKEELKLSTCNILYQTSFYSYCLLRLNNTFVCNKSLMRAIAKNHCLIHLHLLYKENKIQTDV